MKAQTIRDVLSLAFLEKNQSLVISGSIHSDMNDLAHALGHMAGREGASVLIMTAGTLLELLVKEKTGDSSIAEAMHPARAKLLVIENFARKKLTPSQTRSFAELMTERFGRSSTIITSTRLLSQWAKTITGSEEGKRLLDTLFRHAQQVVIGCKRKETEKKPAPVDQPVQACG